MFRAALAVALLLLVACSAEVRTEDSGVLADWPEYGATKGGSRHSPLDQITPENVHRLEVAWTHRSGDFQEKNKSRDEEQSAFQATPILVGERLVFCSPLNRVFALRLQCYR